MKKTLLATACSMGYDRCKLYIDWLEMMELIRKEIGDDGREELLLTEKGRLLYSKNFDLQNMYEGTLDKVKNLKL